MTDRPVGSARNRAQHPKPFLARIPNDALSIGWGCISRPLLGGTRLLSSQGDGELPLGRSLAVPVVNCVLALVLSLLPTSLRAAPSRLHEVAANEAGMNAEQLARIDSLVQQGLEEGRMPGCVIAIGRHGKLVFLKAYGQRRLQPESEPMTTDTVFDLASLTKPIATATSIMILMEQGRLRLADGVADYLPAFGVRGKEEITIEQLLTHHSGLIADNPLDDYEEGPEKAIDNICALTTTADPGTRFIYSDVNYIVLAEIIRQISGQNVHEFTQQHLFQPLGLEETGFLPSDPLRQRAAPTEQRDGHWMQGEVHDPRAAKLGGIAGHAGLFSTVADLAVYAQMMLDRGCFRGTRILGPATVEKMTSAYEVSGELRGLGWDKRSRYSSNRSELFTEQAFGHGGFTGTVLWVDPGLDLFFIFLSNRVHPDGKGNVNSLAGRIATVAASAVVDLPPRSNATPSADGPQFSAVQTGLDRLQQDHWQLLAGQRVGLITNHTGIDRQGRTNIQLMRDAPEVNLVALFSPEHGLAGQLDQAVIADSTESSTGLRIYSLYAETRRPTAEQLAEIDTLVFDIQDIGTRFYTYVSTMGLALQAAAEHGKRFVVLDRPNPINGIHVQGPVLDEGRQSFVGFHTLPVRHGMTVGELARMFQSEMKLDVDLHIVTLDGWRRGQYFDNTGLIWVDPSPNMRNLNQALLYPGVGLLETTNLSVGRGTDTPFERIGAPWLDGVGLAEDLNRAGLAGVQFTPRDFRPSASVYQDTLCHGIQILITDRSSIQPLQVGFQIASCLREKHPEEWKMEAYDRLLADQNVWQAVQEARPASSILRLYADELQQFRLRRSAFLLYSE